MGNLGIRQDEEIVKILLHMLQRMKHDGQHEESDEDVATTIWKAHITSGYFNFTERYQELTLASECPVNIITASPQVFG